jgi:hypothetical protein
MFRKPLILKSAKQFLHSYLFENNPTYISFPVVIQISVPTLIGSVARWYISKQKLAVLLYFERPWYGKF